ncbi:type II secretion system protein GspM [Pseudothauera rhizosphaerae]|uniref:Type II secretion system protein M n=1 Tax=Pseudothauera rhizosphaerae TaxID=2565932 RepID=A0A4S4AMR2_9RHOO|nr:type II secretion system protein GspM [Pseudothauera rhizosphaerae]THF60461.1 type II secretion system protein M [Pseudothauera rhizosphaerae]
MTARPSALRAESVPAALRRFTVLPVGGVMARLRARLQPVHAQATSRWRGLAPRERKQILLMVAVLAGAAVWLLFTKPALDTLRYWGEEMPRLRSQAAALRDILADVGGVPSALGAQTGPPAARTSASLDQIGLAGTYRMREDGTTLIIGFEQPVDAARLTTWLLNAPAGLGLAVERATLQRIDGDEHGIKASVTLAARQRQPGNGT